MIELSDDIQFFVWTITYILIAYNGIKYREEYPRLFPWFAGSLTIAWEINALIALGGAVEHIVWLSIDAIIFILNARNFKTPKNIIWYVLFTIVVIFAMQYVFAMNGMLLSSFIIDLVIAVEFIATAKKISRHGQVIIAITKLIGDAFAWLAYFSRSTVIAVLGILVLIANILYLAYSLELNSLTQTTKNNKLKKR